jgi:hypothetical protein
VNTTDQDGSIDAVANSLLMTEDNAASAPEVDDEEQSAEAIDDGEAADDVEPDAIEGDDEESDDDTAEVDDEPQESLYTVMVDGKPHNVTLEQLKQGWSGQSALQKRFEAVANQRKELEAMAEQLQNEASLLAQTRQRTDAGVGLVQPTPPSRQMFDQDPIGFMDAQLTYSEQMAEYQNTQQMLLMAQQRHEAHTNAQHQARLQEEMTYLQQAIPEFADPQKATVHRDKLVKGAVEHYGLTAEMVASESDHRAIRILNDAIKYREMLEKSQGAQAKMQSARPVIKAGVKHNETQGSVKAKQKIVSQMRSTGSVDDVARFLLT